jgi:serine/threonine protein kinase/tetratricopeptide (TPR) repeat protein
VSTTGRQDLLRRALALFQQAAELPPAEREALLREQCAAEPELRRQVEALAAADERAGDFLAAPAAEQLGPWFNETGGDPVDIPWAGRRLGSYRIVRELGRGGMGTVFLAERVDGQFDQQVALKVVRQGFFGEDLRRRFVRERQILALLQHPNIARLLDGGVAPEGLPYFVMELVSGTPITAFCDRQALGPEERLRLFLGVCAAVQHAHRSLVVHRDLKPSNILVTAAADVKLLDFGIAKLLGEEAAQAAAGVTRTAAPLTPAYAAPEQLRGEPVTTATDVYALGVVLYELLAGHLPADPPGAGRGGELAPALARAAAGWEPPRPSTVAEPAGGPAGNPPAAGADPRTRRRRRRRLRGDLDTIVLTAMRHAPERRYPSADALAEDLRRHLAGLPIRARPDTPGYRLGKFVRRHLLGVAATALLLAALLAALASAGWQASEKAREARRAEEEARTAGEVTRFVMSLFEGSDPSHARGATVTARELLDEAARRIRGSLAGQPVVRARLLHTLATIQFSLGLFDRARPLAAEALALRRANLPAGDPQIADSLDQLGTILVQQADYGGAGPLLREALAMRRRAAGKQADPHLAVSLENLANLLHKTGDLAGAEALYGQALAVARRGAARPADDPGVAQLLSELAANTQDRGRYGAAAGLYAQALEIRERVLGDSHPAVAATLTDFGSDLVYLGRFDEAEAKLGKALTLREKVLGPDHPDVGFTKLALADLDDTRGRYDAAEREVGEALAIFRRSLGEAHRQVTECLNFLAALKYRRDDLAGAEALFRQVVARSAAALGGEHPDTLSSKGNLAMTLRYEGKLVEAERLLRETLAARRRTLGDQHIDVAQNLENLGGLLVRIGRAGEAVPQDQAAVAIYQRALGPVHAQTAIALRELGVAEAAAGMDAGAEAHLREALAVLRQLHKEADPHFVRIPLAYGDLLLAQRRQAEAEPILRQVLATVEADRESSRWVLAEARLLLGSCLEQRGERAPAAALLRAGRASMLTQTALVGELLPQARAALRGDG